MKSDQDDPIDLRLLVDVPVGGAVSVTRAELRDALEANRAQGSKRRLSSDAHIELAIRHKRGEPATRLGLAFGISSGSVGQAVGRVERAAKRLRPKASATETASSTPKSAKSATAQSGLANRKPAAPSHADSRHEPADQTHNGAAGPTPQTRTDHEPTAAIETGPFLREILDAIRPIAGPSHVSNAELHRVAGNLEKIANLMHKRADLTDK